MPRVRLYLSIADGSMDGGRSDVLRESGAVAVATFAVFGHVNTTVAA